jgi:lipopolysaccharide export system permease protein
MKKTVYKYFFYEFLRYFIVALIALSAIVWAVQAINFLDLVTEDGHAFTIYFTYSLLTLSKIYTKLIPFCFLISIVLTILKFEKDNELLILWTSGLNKIHMVNLIFRISLIIMLLQLVFANIVNPTLLNLSRSILKNSELQFIPSLLKQKTFNDTIESLTIFVDTKNENGIYKNIFILDEGNILSNISNTSSTIFAKSGYVSSDEKSLVLLNGNIQKLNVDGNVNIVEFDKTILNLEGITTKSISEPKIQETSTLEILSCIKYQSLGSGNCERYAENYTDTKIEINKRFGMPFFIPLISLVCCFILMSRKDKKITAYKKYIYFFIGFVILMSGEITVRYSGISWHHTLIYYLIPIVMLPLFYVALIRTIKHENLT